MKDGFLSLSKLACKAESADKEDNESFRDEAGRTTERELPDHGRLEALRGRR